MPLRDIGDLPRELRRVFVAEEWERAGFSRMVARRTVVKEDWCDIAVEGNLFRSRGPVVPRRLIGLMRGEANSHHE